MTTKSDFAMLGDLRNNYTPATRGIVTAAESAKIKRLLELEQRNDIELQNIRDMTVMFYGNWADNARDGSAALFREVLDAMSAITAVIDGEKWRRGLEV